MRPHPWFLGPREVWSFSLLSTVHSFGLLSSHPFTGALQCLVWALSCWRVENFREECTKGSPLKAGGFFTKASSRHLPQSFIGGSLEIAAFLLCSSEPPATPVPLGCSKALASGEQDNPPPAGYFPLQGTCPCSALWPRMGHTPQSGAYSWRNEQKLGCRAQEEACAKVLLGFMAPSTVVRGGCCFLSVS